ncbi:type IA DNA topoisomerase [uncultured Duncaniella sp.]|jgi:DNA topoisomerase-3|uniref:type IA DNA topoisomerase n=1 Tax=Duncaniella dubosii TaxID=2518971 RepID=UPI002675D2A4|nr:type IA DNA topoisomerase [uncultured Duncaniella sp.]
MITIIAQNQQSALAIARATENDEMGNRYYYGAKYYITWAIHRMVEITTPRGIASYWFRNQSFPNLPKYLTLSVTTRTSNDGTQLTQEAATQLDTIKSLLAKSDSIIVATAPTQEGELTFRYLYAYLNCTLPYRRAIISELTVKGINRAISFPMDPENFDKWYTAARLRDEADWYIGVNARRALAFAAGRGTYQIGRTSASVLKMIQERNIAIANFEAVTSGHTTIAVKDSDGNIIPMSSIEPNNLTPKSTSEVNILSVEKEEIKVKTPKLYNLVTLQMDAARVFGLSPQRTYDAAVALYFRKLISYPVVAGSTVSKRKYQECRKVLDKMLAYTNYASVAYAQMDVAPGRSVDKTSPMGTHGIVATGVPPLVIKDDLSKVYHLIVKRMYQAFSKDVVINRYNVLAECEGVRYRWTGETYKAKGWHSLFPDTAIKTLATPKFSSGESVELFSVGSCTKKSVAPKGYTDDTLIEELLKVRGSFQSFTIAKDVVHLETVGLIERDPWGIISLTTKGKLLYSIIKDMKIADLSMVVSSDELMRQVMNGKLSRSAFETSIKNLSCDITAEILASAKLYPRMEEDIPCPHCSEGVMKTFGRVAKCDNPGCGHYIFRQFYGVTLSHEELAALINDRKTPEISGFKSWSGKPFKARVIINQAGNPQVVSKNKSENI